MSRDYDSLIQFCSSAALVKVIKDTLSAVLYGLLTVEQSVSVEQPRVRSADLSR
jgi:hypothetical protein